MWPFFIEIFLSNYTLSLVSTTIRSNSLTNVSRFTSDLRLVGLNLRNEFMYTLANSHVAVDSHKRSMRLRLQKGIESFRYRILQKAFGNSPFPTLFSSFSFYIFSLHFPTYFSSFIVRGSKNTEKKNGRSPTNTCTN